MRLYPLGTALARPLIAEKVVEVARRVGADAVAHGSTSKGNDQVRFDVTVKALAPDLKIVAPARIWGMTRAEEIEYARRHGLPIGEVHKKYSIDDNLWSRSIEGALSTTLEKSRRRTRLSGLCRQRRRRGAHLCQNYI